MENDDEQGEGWREQMRADEWWAVRVAGLLLLIILVGSALSLYALHSAE